MKIQLMITNNEIKSELIQCFQSTDVTYSFSSKVDTFIRNSMQNTPEMFIIQHHHESSLILLDVVKDLRILFGSFPTILVVGEKITKKMLTALISEGVNNYISFPIDIMLLEDFIYKKTQNSHCRPFLYRHVPSGETEITVDLEIQLRELNESGIIFNTNDLIVNGTIFEVDLRNAIAIRDFTPKVKILSSEKNENNTYTYLAEFDDLDIDTTKQLSYQLKGHQRP